jgi:HD-GYP domain-containing protein (c-di-GMP phosphodiesterase class II)
MDREMQIRLSEVVAALSHALDVTHGQPEGHAARTCLIGMRVGEAIGLESTERSALFYALLLKDAGCSTNASRIASLYGNDDAEVKRQVKTEDLKRPAAAIRHVWRAAGAGERPAARVRQMYRTLVDAPAAAREIYALRCERGADIARMIGLGEATAEGIAHLDERWDGAGLPTGASGEDIPIIGRILALAQTLEVFWQLGGPSAAADVARRRRGTWFDPALVDALGAIEHDAAFWSALPTARPDAVEPADRVLVAGDDRLDRIAEAFARVVDAKSPYTGRHSEGVAEIAVGLAGVLGLGDDDRRTLRRAGLLHDLGKLAVSNRILDKPGRLTEEEWSLVRAHPALSERILLGVGAFGGVARIAGNHHERLDGSGYGRGRRGAELDPLSRILAVADVAEALSAERPYRGALAPGEVLDIMRAEAGTRLDATAFEALEEHLPAHAAPAGAAAA